MSETRILVLGGSGVVGRMIVEDFMRNLPDVRLSIASRAPMQHENFPVASLISVDIDDDKSLRSVCQNQDLVIMAAGSFEKFGTRVQCACMAVGVDCLDINDSDLVAREILDLDAEARKAGVRLVTGLGLTPGLTTWMLRCMARQGKGISGDYAVRLFMGAKHGGGAASPEVLLSGFRNRIPVFRNNKTEEMRTPWRDDFSPCLFPGKKRPLDFLPFPSPEAVTLPFKGAAWRLNIRSLDHRYHIEFLPRFLARALAWSRLPEISAVRGWLVRTMYRSGQKLKNRKDASETTTLVVAPVNEKYSLGEGIMLHGPVSPAYITASFLVSVALSFLQKRHTVLSGVHTFESFESEDWNLDSLLSERGIILVSSSIDTKDYKSFFGQSSASTGMASGLRHFGKFWYSLGTIPPVISGKQREILKRSRFWCKLREELSFAHFSLIMLRAIYKRQANIIRLQTEMSSIKDCDIRCRVYRDFALFAAGYSEAQKILGSIAKETYAEMFLDSGAMEMAWFWPSSEVFAASRTPAMLFIDYLAAYFAELHHQGMLRQDVIQNGNGVFVVTITHCIYANILERLGCGEFGSLVREMELSAISKVAQACGLSFIWSAGLSPGSGTLTLGLSPL